MKTIKSLFVIACISLSAFALAFDPATSVVEKAELQLLPDSQGRPQTLDMTDDGIQSVPGKIHIRLYDQELNVKDIQMMVDVRLKVEDELDALEKNSGDNTGSLFYFGDIRGKSLGDLLGIYEGVYEEMGFCSIGLGSLVLEKDGVDLVADDVRNISVLFENSTQIRMVVKPQTEDNGDIYVTVTSKEGKGRRVKLDTLDEIRNYMIQ